jgi:hypothetical protein
MEEKLIRFGRWLHRYPSAVTRLTPQHKARLGLWAALKGSKREMKSVMSGTGQVGVGVGVGVAAGQTGRSSRFLSMIYSPALFPFTDDLLHDTISHG